MRGDSLPIGDSGTLPGTPLLVSGAADSSERPPRAAQAVADSTFHRDKLLSCACLSVFRYLTFSTKYSHPASHPLVKKTIYTRIRIHRTRASRTRPLALTPSPECKFSLLLFCVLSLISISLLLFYRLIAAVRGASNVASLLENLPTSRLQSLCRPTCFCAVLAVIVKSTNIVLLMSRDLALILARASRYFIELPRVTWFRSRKGSIEGRLRVQLFQLCKKISPPFRA